MNSPTVSKATTASSAPLTWRARLIGLLVGIAIMAGSAGLFVLNHKIANSSGHLTTFGVTGMIIGALIVFGTVSAK